MSTLDAPQTVKAERRWVAIGLVIALGALALQVIAGFAREAVSDEPSYLELVEVCLTERATAFEPVVGDFVALSAGRGALRTSVDGNPVTVALGRSEDDAERLYEAYISVAASDIGTRLEQRRKVVFLWDREPTTAQRDFMVLCTLDAQE